MDPSEYSSEQRQASKELRELNAWKADPLTQELLNAQRVLATEAFDKLVDIEPTSFGLLVLREQVFGELRASLEPLRMLKQREDSLREILSEDVEAVSARKFATDFYQEQLANITNENNV